MARPVVFDVDDAAVKLSKIRRMRHTDVSVAIAGSEDVLIESRRSLRTVHHYDIHVGNALRLTVVPDVSKAFPSKYSIMQNGEAIGLIDIHEKILFNGLVVMLPKSWPQAMRLMLMAVIWNTHGR